MSSPSKTKRLRSDSNVSEFKVAKSEPMPDIDPEELLRILKDLEEKRQELAETKEKLQSTEDQLNRVKIQRFLAVEELKRVNKEHADITYVQETDSIITERIGETIDQFWAGGSRNLAAISMLRRVLGAHFLYVNSLVADNYRQLRRRAAAEPRQD